MASSSSSSQSEAFTRFTPTPRPPDDKFLHRTTNAIRTAPPSPATITLSTTSGEHPPTFTRRSPRHHLRNSTTNYIPSSTTTRLQHAYNPTLIISTSTTSRSVAALTTQHINRHRLPRRTFSPYLHSFCKSLHTSLATPCFPCLSLSRDATAVRPFPPQHPASHTMSPDDGRGRVRAPAGGVHQTGPTREGRGRPHKDLATHTNSTPSSAYSLYNITTGCGYSLYAHRHNRLYICTTTELDIRHDHQVTPTALY